VRCSELERDPGELLRRIVNSVRVAVPSLAMGGSPPPSTGIAITWSRATHARDYLVTITQGTAVLTRAVTTATQLTFGTPEAELAIAVQGPDPLGGVGRTTTVTVH
jgi:hypothetical protein